MPIKRWSKADDAKLAAYFRQGRRNGGINSTDLTKSHIDEVIKEFFPDRKYSSFAPLFRNKARAWNLANSLNGSRREQVIGTPATGNEDEASDNEPDEANATDAADETGEELAKAKEDTTKTEEKDISFLSVGMENMSVSNNNFNMGFNFPYFMYTYTSQDRKRCSIDFVVLGINQKNLRLTVKKNNVFELGCMVPRVFLDRERLRSMNQNVPNFSDDTHKSTAFNDASVEVQKAVGIEEDDSHLPADDQMKIFGEPQKIQLPFPCEEEIVSWTIVLADNPDRAFQRMCESHQFFFLLSVDLVAVEKRKVRVTGTFQKLGSPGLTNGGIENPDDDVNEIHDDEEM